MTNLMKFIILLVQPHLLNIKRTQLKQDVSLWTLNLLENANKNNSRILQASTSEVYGDPNVSPQGENYFGNVNQSVLEVATMKVKDLLKHYSLITLENFIQILR